MSAPNKDWICRKCGEPNPAHAGVCGNCVRDSNASERGIGSTLVIFFPEAIPAAVAMLYAPFWAMTMFANGNALPALCLIVGGLACGYGFFQGCKQGSKWTAYACMIAFIAITYFVDVAEGA